eukprot:gene6222-7206_t
MANFRPCHKDSERDAEKRYSIKRKFTMLSRIRNTLSLLTILGATSAAAQQPVTEQFPHIPAMTHSEMTYNRNTVYAADVDMNDPNLKPFFLQVRVDSYTGTCASIVGLVAVSASNDKGAKGTTSSEYISCVVTELSPDGQAKADIVYDFQNEKQNVHKSGHVKANFQLSKVNSVGITASDPIATSIDTLPSRLNCVDQTCPGIQRGWNASNRVDRQRRRNMALYTAETVKYLSKKGTTLLGNPEWNELHQIGSIVPVSGIYRRKRKAKDFPVLRLQAQGLGLRQYRRVYDLEVEHGIEVPTAHVILSMNITSSVSVTIELKGKDVDDFSIGEIETLALAEAKKMTD